MQDDATVRSGQRHCGAVRFEATLSEGVATIRRCTCSFCRMRGAIAVSAEMGRVRILEGEDVLTSYRASCSIFSARAARSTRITRGAPTRTNMGVNVACLDGVSPFDFDEVPVTDGINRPSDIGGVARQAGVLRCFPSARSRHYPAVTRRPF
jgi:hypothetical protein